MALSKADNNPYTWTTNTSGTVSIVGTDSDRLVVVIVCCRSGPVRTFSSPLLDSVAGTTQDGAINVDGGTACSTGVMYFVDSANPGAGSFTLSFTASAGVFDTLVEVLEFTGADQTTPITTVLSSTFTGQADGASNTVTLTGQTDKYAISYAAIADATSNTAGGGNGPSANLNELDEVWNGGAGNRTRLSVAEDVVVATSSEDYDWTTSIDGSVAIDSVVLGAFAVNAAAGANLLLVNRSLYRRGGIR